MQLQNTCLHSCCRSVLQRTSLMWQNTADDDLCRRPTSSRRPDRLEPCRTVTGRPGRPSWNPPDVEIEANADPVALAWCSRNAERPTPNVQQHSGQTAAGSSDLVSFSYCSVVFSWRFAIFCWCFVVFCSTRAEPPNNLSQLNRGFVRLFFNLLYDILYDAYTLTETDKVTVVASCNCSRLVNAGLECSFRVQLASHFTWP